MATFDVPSSTKTDELRFDSCPTGTSISYGGTGKSTVASFKLPQICVRVSVLVTDAAPRGTAADESAKTDALLAKLRRTIGEKCLPIYRRTTLYTTADSSHVRASYCESRAISDKEKQSIRRGAPISFIDATKRLNLVSETIQKVNETKKSLKANVLIWTWGHRAVSQKLQVLNRSIERTARYSRRKKGHIFLEESFWRDKDETRCVSTTGMR